MWDITRPSKYGGKPIKVVYTTKLDPAVIAAIREYSATSGKSQAEIITKQLLKDVNLTAIYRVIKAKEEYASK